MCWKRGEGQTWLGPRYDRRMAPAAIKGRGGRRTCPSLPRDIMMADGAQRGATCHVGGLVCACECVHGVLGALNQGPVFATAIVAGVMAVKKTSELIPFCHPLPIEKCDIKVVCLTAQGFMAAARGR